MTLVKWYFYKYIVFIIFGMIYFGSALEPRDSTMVRVPTSRVFFLVELKADALGGMVVTSILGLSMITAWLISVAAL